METLVAGETNVKELYYSIEDRTFIVAELESPKTLWQPIKNNFPLEWAMIQNTLGIHSYLIRFKDFKGVYHYELG